MDITMPQLGETVTEGTITRWLKHVGDRVEADEPLFEVSTDKVDSEVPATGAGFVTEIRVPEGETAPVGAVLAVIGDQPGPAAAATTTEPVTRPQPVTPPAEPPTRPEPAVVPPSAPPAPSPTIAMPPPPAPTPPPAPAPTPPAVPAPPPTPAPAVPTPPVRPATPATPTPSGSSALTSPVVRRLIAEHGLDPNQIQGTGEGGRITHNDVLAAARTSAPAPTAAPLAPPPAPAPPAPPPISVPPAAPVAPPAPAEVPPAARPPTAPPPPVAPAPSMAAGGSAAETSRGDEIVPFSNIRRRTGEHMVRSKAISPHVYTSVEVDFEHIAGVRQRNQESWRAREGFPLTYLPFVARAFGAAVSHWPLVNASVGDNALIVHRDVHLAIAVDLDFEGLVAPVIRNADGKRLRLLAREIRDLADRARTKQLLPDEVLGGTFTITNPGPFGTYMTLPIINQPQVAVLSTDGVHRRPAAVVGPDGEDFIAIRSIGIIALAWDHRAFDGAYAAAFLRALKQDLETRDWEVELA